MPFGSIGPDRFKLLHVGPYEAIGSIGSTEPTRAGVVPREAEARYCREVMTDVPRGWELNGLCFQSGDSRFFPLTATGLPSFSDSNELAAAVICRECPVQVACLEQALDYGRDCAGIWGGLGQAKRRKLGQARSTQRAEGFDPHRFTPGCSCRFCVAATALLAGDVIDMNTLGARCGYRSTYGRGHRDPACTFAVAFHTRCSNTIG